MKSFDAFKLYCALKRHFTSSYDYFKYNKKISFKVETFEKHRPFYERLAKQQDVEGYLVANFIYDPNLWIGDIVSSEDSHVRYLQWLARQQSITYHFKEQLDLLSGDLQKDLKGSGKDYPILLEKFNARQISPETIIIFDNMVGILNYWTTNYSDDYQFEQALPMINKYKQFVTYDKSKIKKLFLEKYK